MRPTLTRSIRFLGALSAALAACPGRYEPATDAAADAASDLVSETAAVDAPIDIAPSDVLLDAPGSDALDVNPDGPQIRVPCADTLDHFYDPIANLGPYDATHRGEIVRCAMDRTVTRDQINTAVAATGYSGPPLTSGAVIYRIAYRTDRVMANGTTPGGISAALVLQPTVPAAAQPPLVVVGHGTVGMADACAPSRQDILTSGSGYMTLPLVGHGYMVVSTDYAGFGYGSTSGWLDSDDEAHSLLDATRAMNRFLAPGVISQSVVIVGHSQGGHAVLSAQAEAGTYGLSGNLVGIVAFAPVWFAERTWGAVFTPLGGVTPTNSPGVVAFSISYFYGHGELLDGAGHGLDWVIPSRRDVARRMLTTECLDALVRDIPAMLGPNFSDFVDPTFASSLGSCGAFNASACDTDPAATWKPRWRADRPTFDAHGAPTVIWHGLGDTTIPPPRAQCGFDKIHADLAAATGATASFTVCADPNATHGSVVDGNFDWVNRWIAARTMGAQDPPPCTPWNMMYADGGAITCPGLPPNVD